MRMKTCLSCGLLVLADHTQCPSCQLANPKKNHVYRNSIALLMGFALGACSGAADDTAKDTSTTTDTNTETETETNTSDTATQPAYGVAQYDDDGDGWFAEDGDCDDSNADINPGAAEVCDDGVDNDCDGLIDADDTDDCM